MKVSLNWFNTRRKKSNEKPNMFIHIPKAGGSTFVGLLMDSVKLTESEKAMSSHMIEKVGNTHIRHIKFDATDRTFKEASMFRRENIEKYKVGFNVYCLVRDPVDRIVSEFNFQYHILGGKEGNPRAAIYSQLKGRPDSVQQYAKEKGVRNYQVKFLLGRDIADSNSVKKEEFDGLISAMNEIPIRLGTTDRYDDFLAMFSEESGVKLNSKVLVRKQTPIIYAPFLSDIEREKIRKLNVWDQKLYEYAQMRFKNEYSKYKGDYKFKNSDSFIV